MAIWQDIDLSFQPNVYGDIGTVTDENNISVTLLNNLSITAQERSFENKDNPLIQDLIHAQMDFIELNRLKKIIRNAALQDKRIISVDDIMITEYPNNYTVDVKISLTVDMGSQSQTVVAFQLKTS